MVSYAVCDAITLSRASVFHLWKISNGQTTVKYIFMLFLYFMMPCSSVPGSYILTKRLWSCVFFWLLYIGDLLKLVLKVNGNKLCPRLKEKNLSLCSGFHPHGLGINSLRSLVFGCFSMVEEYRIEFFSLEILLYQPEIRLYLPFSDWFRIKRTSVWLQNNRKMENAV